MPEQEYKQWSASDELGRHDLTVSGQGLLVEIADDDTQRHYRKVVPLAEYAGEVPTDGWTPLRKIVADNFSAAQRAEIEACVAELITRPA